MAQAISHKEYLLYKHKALSSNPILTKRKENNNNTKTQIVGHQWLMPVILTTQEAEVRRISICGQPGKNENKTLSQKNLITRKDRPSGSSCRALA
jgi:hypothetical protein